MPKTDTKRAILSEMAEEATAEILPSTIGQGDEATELALRQTLLWWLERAYDRGANRLRDLEQANTLLQAQVDRLKLVNSRLAKR